ncbi:hypothetical protein [Isoalcanivorax indicus]|uniref:hypothetical protein n=1 Tax=Isoalcanivorax indicus TaxID=2202653 RepID=UPI000DB9CB9E|nr:hypothetical protein [Isoalcanivorax indicus]
MRNVIISIIVSMYFIAGCSDGDVGPSSSVSVAEDAAVGGPQPVNTGNGWLPNEACSFLLPNLGTRGYKHDFGAIYYCSSPYKEIGRRDVRLANNLAYYVTGGRGVADTVKLVLNYNQPANASSATEQLVAESRNLSFKATGNDLPPSILSALLTGQPALETIGAFQHQVKRDDWPTGNGYEVHYIISTSLE